MNTRAAKKIIEDEDTLDIAKLAEAHKSLKPEKPNKKTSKRRQMEGYKRKIAFEQEKEEWRQMVAKVWPKST